MSAAFTGEVLGTNIGHTALVVRPERIEEPIMGAGALWCSTCNEVEWGGEDSGSAAEGEQD